MLTTVADTLFSRLINAFPADRDYRTADFSREPMPAPVREHLKQRLALRLKDIIHPTNGWVDSDHAEVRAAAETYRSVLARHLQIPESEWQSELGLACRTVVSYLVRPVPTLADLIFSDERQEATFEDISEQLRLVPAYSYFGDVIGAYFQQKDLERIGRERFIALARRIDHQMVRDFETDEWMKLLQPLYEIVRQAPELSGGLPVGVMKTFLQEKGADAIAAGLEARFASKGKRFIRPEDMRSLLDHPVAEAPAEAAADAARAEEPAPRRDAPGGGSHVPLWKQFESGLLSSPETEASSASAGASDVAAARASESQPLWKQFRGSEQPSGAPASSARREEPQPSTARGSGRREEQQSSAGRESARREEQQSFAGRESVRWEEQQASTPAGSARREEPQLIAARESARRDEQQPATARREEQQPATARREERADERPFKNQHIEERSNVAPHGVHNAPPDALAELERSVLGKRGMRNRDLFLRHLFSGSSEAYESTLRKLDVAENWSEASQIIAREVFLKHQVNIYSDPAVAFTDAAEAKFRS